MTALRYRAYTKAAATSRKPDVDPWVNEAVAFEGSCKDGRATFDAGDTEITKVVFYTGKPEEEAVAGSATLNAKGKIDCEPDAE